MTGQRREPVGSGDERVETGTPPVRVAVEGRTAAGRAIDLPATVDPAAIARAIRGEAVDGVAVDAPDPGPVHEYVGVVDGTPIRLRAALAAVARSRGETAPEDEAIAECERRLASLDPPSVDVAAARERVAAVSDEETRLHERVAQVRGRVQTLRERGDDEALADAETALDEAVAALTEARTERIAAEQALERARERAREARDVRERRLELEDRIGNLRRAAREYLARTVFDGFRSALRSIPGGENVDSDGPGEYDGDDAAAALAVVRVADLRAPVVLARGRFEDAAAAVETLDAPVVRVAPE